MRAVRAGFTKFWPMPPNICFTTTIATTPPNAAIRGLMVTGRFRASKRPVTMQERSPTVWGRFMALRERYSLSTQLRMQTAITSRALGPKMTTDAMAAGQSPMITSSMMFRVVFFPLK